MPLLCCCAVLGGCSGRAAPSQSPGVELTAGPLRWLMLPEEAQQARLIRTNLESADFLELFWRRRNDPRGGVNECARLFRERVEAADRLYGEDGQRGSLTDRGRALILLGPPPLLRYGQRRIPAWQPGPTSSPSLRARQVAVETWIYPFPELSPELAARLQAAGAAGEVGAELVFLSDSPRHTRLVDGERVLQLAALSLVVELPAKPHRPPG